MPDATVSGRFASFHISSPNALFAESLAELMEPVFTDKPKPGPKWTLKFERVAKEQLIGEAKQLRKQLKTAGVKAKRYRGLQKVRVAKSGTTRDLTFYPKEPMLGHIDLAKREASLRVADTVETPSHHALGLMRECYRAEAVLNSAALFLRGGALNLNRQNWLVVADDTVEDATAAWAALLANWLQTQNVPVVAWDTLFLAPRKQGLEVAANPRVRVGNDQDEMKMAKALAPRASDGQVRTTLEDAAEGKAQIDFATLTRATAGTSEVGDIKGVLVLSQKPKPLTRQGAEAILKKLATVGTQCKGRGDYTELGIAEANLRTLPTVAKTLLALPWACISASTSLAHATASARALA